MSVRGNMIDETRTRRRAMAFTDNLFAMLTFFVVIGFPVAPATIRTILVGWILVVAVIMRFILGRRFPPIGCVVSLRSVRIRSADSGLLR